ncbi:helix-turn-helix domain-containing protein [Pseudomonadota bacterium]
MALLDASVQCHIRHRPPGRFPMNSIELPNSVEQSGDRLERIESLLLQIISHRQCPNPVFSIDEVAKQFNVTKPTVYTWIGAGKLKSLKQGGRRWITAKAIETFKNEAEKNSIVS